MKHADILRNLSGRHRTGRNPFIGGINWRRFSLMQSSTVNLNNGGKNTEGEVLQKLSQNTGLSRMQRAMRWRSRSAGTGRSVGHNDAAAGW